MVKPIINNLQKVWHDSIKNTGKHFEKKLPRANWELNEALKAVCEYLYYATKYELGKSPKLKN